MKNLKFIFALFASILFTGTCVNAQSTGEKEFDILKKLSSEPVVSVMPVYNLLNAPGNEKLRSFFLTPVSDNARLKGKRIAVIAADGFEEIEMLGPVWYFRALGATVDIIAPKYNPTPARFGLTSPEMAKTHIMAIQYLNPVGWVKVDRTADQIKVSEYDALFIPGGAWNPDNLRADKDVIKFVQDFFKAGKLTAAICHAPVVFATAGILKGKKLTGYWNIEADIKNAGGQMSDVPVVVDGNLITSRHPIDVQEFSVAVADWLAGSKK